MPTATTHKRKDYPESNSNLYARKARCTLTSLVILTTYLILIRYNFKKVLTINKPL